MFSCFYEWNERMMHFSPSCFLLSIRMHQRMSAAQLENCLERLKMIWDNAHPFISNYLLHHQLHQHHQEAHSIHGFVCMTLQAYKLTFRMGWSEMMDPARLLDPLRRLVQSKWKVLRTIWSTSSSKQVTQHWESSIGFDTSLGHPNKSGRMFYRGRFLAANLTSF